MNLNWKNRKKEEPEEPFMSMGWSNHLLAYSKKEGVWFEAVYNFKTKEFMTLDHVSLEDFKITHFCEEIPTP